jgi:hypothetical protein
LRKSCWYILFLTLSRNSKSSVACNSVSYSFRFVIISLSYLTS